MKQIVDKLNKIARAITDNVAIPNRKLIIDSLDAITKALGKTPHNSHLIVDKLDDIANAAKDWQGHGGGGGGGEEAAFLYKQVKIVIVDEITGNVPYADFSVSLSTNGFVTPQVDKRITTPVDIFYQVDGNIIVNPEHDTMWLVNYVDFRPFLQPRYRGELNIYELINCEIEVTGTNCTVNEIHFDKDGYQIDIDPAVLEDAIVTITCTPVIE